MSRISCGLKFCVPTTNQSIEFATFNQQSHEKILSRSIHFRKEETYIDHTRRNKTCDKVIRQDLSPFVVGTQNIFSPMISRTGHRRYSYPVTPKILESEGYICVYVWRVCILSTMIVGLDRPLPCKTAKQFPFSPFQMRTVFSPDPEPNNRPPGWNRTHITLVE